MNRRTFVTSLAASVPLVASRFSHASAVEAATKKTSSAGQPSERYRLTLNRVLKGSGPAYTPEFLLEDIRATGGRRFTNFSGDVSGRWIGALASSSRTYGGDFPILDDVVSQVVALQHAEGYFGKVFRYENQDDNDMALLWGNGRLLVGLMEYHALRPTPEVLNSAKRLGDFLVKIGPDFNTQKKADEFGAAHYGSSYICWTQQTEGLAALYAATKEARYRDLCNAISSRIERRPSDHVHGYLCSLRGIVQLYETTGDPALLAKATAEWNGVMHSGDVLVTGGVPERWSPLRLRTEGCAECDWLRLNLALYRVTGESAYLDAAEKTIFNEFAMNQFSTGDLGHAELDPEGTPMIVRTRAWWCCTLHGLRAFSDLHQSAFRSKGDDVFYDLAVDGAIANESFAAQAESNLATDGTVRISISKARGQALTIRKPAWADAVVIEQGGRKISGTRVERVRSGDAITVRFAMSLREEKAGSSAALASRKTLFFGPWLLGASSQENIGFFNEHQSLNQVLRGTSVPAAQAQTSPFQVPAAAFRYTYIPSEFPDQPIEVQIRAVAEQTASLPATWETTFRMEDETTKKIISA